MNHFKQILQRIWQLPHRGSVTENERKSAELIEDILRDFGIHSRQQKFTAPKTGNLEVMSAATFGAAGAFLAPFYPFVGAIIATVSLWIFWRYFTGHTTVVTKLFPAGESQNVVAQITGRRSPHQKIILMTHYDTARNEIRWNQKQTRGFRIIFIVDTALHFFLVPWSWLGSEIAGYPWYQLTCLGIGLFYTVQMGIFLQREISPEYVSSASDNATGVALVLRLAEYFKTNPLDKSDIQILFTGAKEAGMYGSREFLENDENECDIEQTCVLNFDNAGTGDLYYCTGEGMLSFWAYDQSLLTSAEELSNAQNFQSVRKTRYDVGYFDTLPFVQAGYRCITFAGLDKNTIALKRHQGSDNYNQINWHSLDTAYNWAKEYIQKLDRNGVRT